MFLSAERVQRELALLAVSHEVSVMLPGPVCVPLPAQQGPGPQRAADPPQPQSPLAEPGRSHGDAAGKEGGEKRGESRRDRRSKTGHQPVKHHPGSKRKHHETLAPVFNTFSTNSPEHRRFHIKSQSWSLQGETCWASSAELHLLNINCWTSSAELHLQFILLKVKLKLFLHVLCLTVFLVYKSSSCTWPQSKEVTWSLNWTSVQDGSCHRIGCFNRCFNTTC